MNLKREVVCFYTENFFITGRLNELQKRDIKEYYMIN